MFLAKQQEQQQLAQQQLQQQMLMIDQNINNDNELNRDINDNNQDKSDK